MRKRSSGYSISIFSLFIVIVIIACFTATALLHRTRAAGSYGSNDVRYTTYVVKEGDTIWGIAQKNMSDSFPSYASYINEVMRANHMTDSMIHPGDLIAVPAGDDSVSDDALAMAR